MHKVGIVAHAGNLNWRVGLRWPGKCIDWNAYYREVSDLGEVTEKILLIPKGLAPVEGWTIRETVSPYQFTLDAIRCYLAGVTRIILGTNDYAAIPLVHYLRNSGVDVIMFGCGIGQKFDTSKLEITFKQLVNCGKLSHVGSVASSPESECASDDTGTEAVA